MDPHVSRFRWTSAPDLGDLNQPEEHLQMHYQPDAGGAALENFLDRLDRHAARTDRVCVLALSYDFAMLLEGLPTHPGLAPGSLLADLAVYVPSSQPRPHPVPQCATPLPPVSNFVAESALSRETYLELVERIRQLIAAGDVYQLNLVRTLAGSLPGGLLPWFETAAAHQVAPYLTWLRRGGLELLSLSPESFLRRDGGRLVASPIKGTAPRSPDPLRDLELARALEADPKNRAENVMIADLLRNDLGRVARSGGVRVRRLCALESFPTVHHLVTEVEADVARDVAPSSILRATFPCGSITGAPKRRAMELIRELEPEPRGFSMGAIGWFRGWEQWELCVSIRTLSFEGGRWRYPVGGAITWDSHPEAEWEETITKCQALAGVMAEASRTAESCRA